MAKALVNPRSVYTWDQKSLRYRGPNGAFVSQKAIKQSLVTYVRRVQREIEKLAGQMAAGQVTVAEWQRQTANLIKSAHLANAAAAKGGWAAMTAVDYGKVGQTLRRQYGYLREFAKKARTLAPGQIVNRAGMYARASAATYEDFRRDMHRAAGYLYERNVLGQSEHCPGCLEQTARGWVGIGELVPIGSRDCLTKCRCTLRFAKRKPS